MSKEKCENNLQPSARKKTILRLDHHCFSKDDIVLTIYIDKISRQTHSMLTRSLSSLSDEVIEIRVRIWDALRLG